MSSSAVKDEGLTRQTVDEATRARSNSQHRLIVRAHVAHQDRQAELIHGKRENHYVSNPRSRLSINIALAVLILLLLALFLVLQGLSGGIALDFERINEGEKQIDCLEDTKQ